MNKIAMNPRRCPNRGQAFTATLAEYDRLTREPWLKELVAQIRNSHDEEEQKKLKEQLPFRCAHYYHFQGDHRRQKSLDQEAFLFQTTVDVDDASVVEEAKQKALALNQDPRSPWQGLLLHMEYSARRKLHIDLRMPQGLTVEETQRQYCQALGIPFDESCTTPERMIYITDAASEIYRSPEWYAVGAKASPPTRPLVEYSETSETSEHSERSAEGRLQSKNSERSETAERPHGERLFPTSYKGIPYADIIARYWEKTGGRPTQGERNVRLHKLACNLRAICDNSPEWLMSVMPRLGISEAELEAICKSACKEPVKGSRMVDEIVRSLQDEHSEVSENSEDSEVSEVSEFSEFSEVSENSSLITLHSLLRSLPPALRATLQGVPENLQWPVLASVLPLQGALADGVEVDYCDGQRQSLGLMSIVVGEQASGKSVCKQAVDLWKRQLEAEDEQSREREDQWKEQKRNRKANERAPEDPRVLIRVVPVTVSCSTLLKRLKNSRSHCLYSFGEELDTLRKTNGAGSWSSKYDIYRLGFDRGEWGQDYNSDQAVSGTVSVAYNWSMLGTYGALRKCFKSENVENGLSSRVIIAEMPDGSYAPMPKYGRRTLRDDAAIDQGVARLRAAGGVYNLPRLRGAIAAWVEQKRIEAMKDLDRVKDTYRKRAAVIGFRAGVICHLLAADKRESKTTLEFATTIAELTLRGQMKMFGEELSAQLEGGSNASYTTSNKSVFERLPVVFNIGDVRATKGKTSNVRSIYMTIKRWTIAGMVEKVDSHNWQKCNVSTFQHRI